MSIPETTMLPLPASPVMNCSIDYICGDFWSWSGFEDRYGWLGNNHFSSESDIFILFVAE